MTTTTSLQIGFPTACRLAPVDGVPDPGREGSRGQQILAHFGAVIQGVESFLIMATIADPHQIPRADQRALAPGACLLGLVSRLRAGVEGSVGSWPVGASTCWGSPWPRPSPHSP